MSNVGTLATIKQQAQYLGDGVLQVLEAVERFLPPAAKTSDNLTLYTAVAPHTKVEISDTAGVIPIALIAQSGGTACTVHLYAEDADDVTVGTTDSILQVQVSATAGEITAACLFGKGVHTIVNATNMDGLTIAAPTTTQGTSDATNDPTVWVLYY